MSCVFDFSYLGSPNTKSMMPLTMLRRGTLSPPQHHNMNRIVYMFSCAGRLLESLIIRNSVNVLEQMEVLESYHAHAKRWTLQS